MSDGHQFVQGVINNNNNKYGSWHCRRTWDELYEVF